MEHSEDLHSSLMLADGRLRLPPGSLPRGSFVLLERARRSLNHFTRFELAPLNCELELQIEPAALAPQLLDAMPADVELPYSLGEYLKFPGREGEREREWESGRESVGRERERERERYIRFYLDLWRKHR